MGSKPFKRKGLSLAVGMSLWSSRTMVSRATSVSTCARASQNPFWSPLGLLHKAQKHGISTSGRGYSNIISSLATGVICALALTTLSPSKAAADVLSFNRDGSVRTSNWSFHGQVPAWARHSNQTDTVVTTAAPNVPSAISSNAQVLELIQTTATRHQQNRALTRAGLSSRDWQILFQAMIEAESSYNPTAVSPVGAYGLGQLMPATARALGVDPHNVSQNLDGAARYLLAQLAEFHSVDLALAAYNAGPHRVVEYSGVPPFSETRAYIARIHRIRIRLADGAVLQPALLQNSDHEGFTSRIHAVRRMA